MFGTWTAFNVDGARERAESILADYASSVVESATPDIQKDALRGSAWRAIGFSVAANVLYTLLLIFVVVILKFSGVDLLGLAEKIRAH